MAIACIFKCEKNATKIKVRENAYGKVIQNMRLNLLFILTHLFDNRSTLLTANINCFLLSVIFKEEALLMLLF